MAYLTESTINNIIDHPIALSSTDLRMGDWVVVSVLRVVTPMRLTYRMCNISISASSVDTSLISSGNKLYGNNGLAFLTLRRNYISGNPGEAGGLDSLVAYGLGVYSRDITQPIIVTTPGIYSWIIANNMQPSTDASPVIPTSTSIDFRLSVTGSARLELDNS